MYCVSRSRSRGSVSALAPRGWEYRLDRGRPSHVPWRRTLIGGWAPSLICRLVSTGQSSFFFQPVPRDFALADLWVSCGLQFFLLLLPTPAATRYYPRHCVLDRSLPLGNRHGMDPRLRGQCVHRFLTTDGGACHPRFELAAVLPSLVTHSTWLLLLPTLAYSVVQFLGYIIMFRLSQKNKGNRSGGRYDAATGRSSAASQ